MPYVIDARDTSRAVYNGETGVSEYESIKRRAVATLDEAHDLALDVYDTHTDDRSLWPDFADALRMMPDEGVEVGPLPDGTVIIVKRASVDDLLMDVPIGHPIFFAMARAMPSDAAIVDA